MLKSGSISCPASPLEFNSTKRRLARCGNIDDLRLLAKRRLPGGVFDYFDGAAEDEIAKANNSSLCQC